MHYESLIWFYNNILKLVPYSLSGDAIAAGVSLDGLGMWGTLVRK